MLRVMSDPRPELIAQLEAHYRSFGWKTAVRNGIVEAAGPGGVAWLGRPVVLEDIESLEFPDELATLAERRMAKGGELCPLELLPAAGCEKPLAELIERLGLRFRPHVSIYSLAAAA